MQRLIYLLISFLLVSCGGGTTSPAETSGTRLSAMSTTASYTAPQSGWWWNPAESGSGYAIENQGNVLFLAAFMYDDAGKPMWYTAALARQASGDYMGELSRFEGGQSLTGAYKTPTKHRVGKASLAFSVPDRGTLRFESDTGSTRTTTIERFAFGDTPFTGSTFTGQNGWWWNASESGRGFFVEVQGNTAFIAGFMYDDTGKPTWHISAANAVSGQTVSGNLIQFSGGQSLTGAYREPLQTASTGAISLRFLTPNSAELNIPNGTNVPLTRFQFGPGGTQSTHCNVNRSAPRQNVPATSPPSFEVSYLMNLPQSTYYPSFMAAMDVDRDGHSDMVVAETAYVGQTPYGARVAIYRGDGKGNFSDATSTLLVGNAYPEHVRDMEIADFNGDGVPDVLFSNHGYDASPFPGARNVLLLNVSGRLVVSDERLGNSDGTFTHSSASADIDCDGDIDVYEGNAHWGASQPKPRLLLNDGAANFSDMSNRLPAYVTNYSRRFLSAEFCDIDNNGTPDLFLGGFNTASELWLNDGRGNFTPASAGTLPPDAFPVVNGEGLQAIEARCVDIDQDGWNDLVQIQLDKPFGTASSPVKRKQLVWKNTRNSRFADVTNQWTPSSLQNTGFMTSMRVIDANGDGWPDLTLGNGESAADGGILLNTGSRLEHIRLGTTANPEYSGLFEIDVDADGTQEYVAMSTTLRLYRRSR